MDFFFILSLLQAIFLSATLNVIINENSVAMLMRRRTYLLGLFLILGLSMATAQSGSEIVSGKVRDEVGPLVMVNVIELDEADRVVSHDVTDFNGNFSIRIKTRTRRKGK